MPSGISNDDLIDLTRTTLENLPDMQFEVALEYNDYEVCNRWFAQDRVQEDSGTSIQRNLILDDSGNAKFVRLYQKTAIGVADVQKQITAPWVQSQTHWSIERREMLRNRQPAQFIDLLKSRRIDSLMSLANLIEERAFKAPQSSTDDLNPRGLPYWISKRDTNSTGEGFDGQTVRFEGGSTSNTKAGLDASASTNAKWRNWAATYNSIDAEFVKKMRKAFHATNFKSPTLVRDLESGERAADYRIYMGLDELTDYEDLVTKQNDNIGADADPFHGMTSFKRIPIIRQSQLDSETHNAVYGVNHKKFFPIVLSGDWLREEGPMTDVEQHNVITTFVDSSFQFFCNNVREGGFVLHNEVT